jgi:hypothetical protein
MKSHKLTLNESKKIAYLYDLGKVKSFELLGGD